MWDVIGLGLLLIITILASYLIGRQHGARRLAYQIRSSKELCWRCDGAGVEKKEVLRY